ncbi:hypothetical protein ACJMK2_003757 [Sinanodonta woodiana]|uniref:SAM domain-containing protein n=1 Tax=Sinanodonta woodiana TaxID=1069815 RepID=A0ABD3Y0Y3_SINWO
MEFLLDGVEYGVAEFYETFCHQVPILVMITAGYCSDFTAETFDQGQVLRIHTCSQQKRVVARQTGGGREQSVSIPINYPIKFCVPKTFGKVKKEQNLKEILETGSLPMVVQFVKSHELYLGSNKVSTDSLPALNLVETFEETYFLSNTVYKGTLDNNLIPIPLYLKDLRLCRIVGFKDQSKLGKWEDFLKELDKQSTHLIYDQTYGNEDIAVYTQTDIHSVSQYEYLQPDRYSDLSVLYDMLDSENNTSVMQEAPVPKSANLVRGRKNNDAHIYTTLRPMSVLDAPMYTTPRPMSVQESTLPKSSNVVLTNIKKTDGLICTTQRPISMHEIQSRSISEIRQMSASETALINELKTELRIVGSRTDDVNPPHVFPKPPARSSEQSNDAPYLPPRRKKIPTPPNEVETFKGDNSSKFDNHNSINSTGETTFNLELPDSTLAVSQAKITNEVSEEPRASSDVDSTLHKTTRLVRTGKELGYEHVTDFSSQVPANQVASKLTIEQVGQYLTVLGLERHVDTFKRNGVDGIILVELDEIVLVEELGLKKLEAIKLMQFVRKGHIPK